MRCSKMIRRIILVVAVLLPCGLSASAQDFSPVVMDRLVLEVQAGDYRIDRTGEGQLIEMEDCGTLHVPGKPMLPSRNLLIALPPGAMARSVEVVGLGAVPLPGTFEIRPAPPMIPAGGGLQDPEEAQRIGQEWKANNRSVYSKDRAYPPVRGKMVTQGTLRKYSYVSVAFFPFDYHPRSGRLIRYEAARIVVDYALPAPGSPAAREVEAMKKDILADLRASASFINYPAVKGSYSPKEFALHDFKSAYLIVTTDFLVDTVLDSGFLEWKRSRGYRVIIAYTVGPTPAQDIRYFIRDRYISWGIEHVLLVGDCNDIPMRYCYPNPDNHTHSPHDPFQYGGEVPTDHYFADLSRVDEFSWDFDRDGHYGEYEDDMVDFMAEVYVGRIPTSDAARVDYALSKIVRYEQDTGDWKYNALHAGAMIHFDNQDHSGVPEVDGANCMNVIETDLMDGWTVSHYSEQDGLKPSDFPWPALTETAFNDDWRDGQYGVVNWFGHGCAIAAARMIWSWDDGDGVPESGEIDTPSFIQTQANLDDDYPAIIWALSCSVGYPEPNSYGNLGVELLTDPSYGAAAAVFSSTRGAAATVGWPASPGGVQSMCYEFHRDIVEAPAGTRGVGEALYDSKFYCHHNFGWDHYYQYMNMYDYNLYGDPAMVSLP